MGGKELKPGEAYCTVIKINVVIWMTEDLRRTVVILTVIFITCVEVIFTVKTLYFQIVETEQFF